MFLPGRGRYFPHHFRGEGVSNKHSHDPLDELSRESRL